MTNTHKYLAIDLGAESGRTIVGSLEDDRLTLAETHRFANQPVCLPDGLHWDVLRLWSEIKTGIGISSTKCNKKLDSIGLDTWGVDFALLDKYGAILSNPYHYRDERTDGMLAEAFRRMSAADIFANTGIQFMQINTLYQLLSMSLQKSPLFDVAEKFVTIPDLFNYWLSGEITNEFTNTTTTQCFDPNKRDWAIPVLDALEIPTHLFGPVTDSGTPIGTLLPNVAEETGACGIQIIAPACHDTGSAVVAVPAHAGNQDFAWISSGTWSIMGAEVLAPYVDERTRQYNFTNEGGVFGTWRLSKNIMGLWLVQECRREWMRQRQELSYAEMTRLAAESQPFFAVIDPDFEGFLHPGDMPSRIQKYCADTNQAVPQTKGQILRIALEGIALKYRLVLERLVELTGKRLDPIHIIGGGTKNRLLNQFAADATCRVVITGPVEATAIGNILMQAIGLKHLGSLAEVRSVVRTSFSPEVYEPQKAAGWDEAYFRLREMIN
ncbi:MAG: rhamnulokinase [Chloroflexi bacterium HGW-Chloroflexi-10]|nr:MAG: rhamnulokinase [Chloroflexi bacterium HGW-Chloroflexi-10]